MTVEEIKLISQNQPIEEITSEEDRKLRLLAKLLVDKLFQDMQTGKVGK